MTPNLKLFGAAIIFLYASWHLVQVAGCHPFLTRPAAQTQNYTPIDTSKDPIQSDYKADQPIVAIRNQVSYFLQPVAKYLIAGRVVSKKRYSPGWDYGLAADLSPVDLAIAWGDLAKPEMDRYISFDHGERFMHYRYKKDIPLTPQYLIEHASNTHLIPANPLIDRVINTVKTDEKVILTGFLVNVTGASNIQNFTWKTSLVRTDTGGGACELMYVTEVQIGSAVYK